ncbi:MAG: hypothetical protein RL131_847 [Bacteroidota bacterium]|jgi:uncharacterized protein (DUF952 family)
MALIYHITTSNQWAEAQKKGHYESLNLKEEGFIHCSMEDQVDDIRERFYQGVSDLVLLKIDTEKLTSQLIYEWSPSVQNTFPHVYGPINLDAVTEAAPLN